MELSPPETTLQILEAQSVSVIGQSWQKKLDSVFLENLGKHRKYDSTSVRDLLRALRNKVRLDLLFYDINAIWPGSLQRADPVFFCLGARF